jgi:hypothetical protein
MSREQSIVCGILSDRCPLRCANGYGGTSSAVCDALGLRARSRYANPVKTKKLFAFPDPVNEVSARAVAAGVVVLCLIAILSGQAWMTLIIAYGFLARVATGPTLSPLGQFVTRVVTPRLGFAPRYVPGPPKRFAQGIGAVLSVGAGILALRFGNQDAADVLLAAIVVAATLESALGLCLGCTIFRWLMRIGVIPERICVACANLRFDASVGGDSSP